MKVLLITSWDTPCGIAEHSAMLKEAVAAADPSIEILPAARALDPLGYEINRRQIDLVHLNYQAGLHSRWTAEIIRHMRQVVPFVVTYHDTGVPNSEQCKQVIAAA